MMPQIADARNVKTATEQVESVNLRFSVADKSSPQFASKRLAREWKTMAAMVCIFCHDQHHDSDLCASCQRLLDYATMRLDRCRFGSEKPTCANCPVHCYQRDRRDEMKIVMRYSGPRMLWRHPVLSLRHWLDGFRKAPALR